MTPKSIPISLDCGGGRTRATEVETAGHQGWEEARMGSSVVV